MNFPDWTNVPEQLSGHLAAILPGAVAAVVLLFFFAAAIDNPAQSSSIVLTTVTDVFGFFSFLGLAAAFSSLL